jgi:hypothetical protein
MAMNPPVAPIIWSDLDPAIVPDVQGNLMVDANVQAVIGSIQNIIQTSPGERVFLPQFALGMQNLVFEPVKSSLLSRYADRIKASVETWDPRVTIAGVDFNTDPDANAVSLMVRFNILGYTQTFTATVPTTS